MTPFEKDTHHRVRQLNYIKKLHLDGKDILLSLNLQKLLKIEDFITKAMIEDFEECGIPTEGLDMVDIRDDWEILQQARIKKRTASETKE